MILAHIWSIATGAAAGLMLIVWMYVLCLAVTPSRMYGSVRSVPHAATIGAALAVLWFWYSLRLLIPASTAAKVLIALTIILLICRRRIIKTSFNRGSIINGDSFFWILLYAAFYATNYIFTLPPVTHDRLPVARIINNDIFNYINIAQYLQHLGPSHIAGFSFVQPLSLMVTFTPSAFYFIEGFSVFFQGDTMRAAMPAIFAITALTGCAITWIVWQNFRIPRALAASIGLLFASGPFLRYIVGNYFLSTIIAELFVLLLLGKTAELLLEKERHKWVSVIFSFAPYHVLIFFTYPPLYVIGLGLQVGFVLISLLQPDANKRDVSDSLRWKALDAGKWITASIASSSIPIMLDPARAHEMLALVFFISNNHAIGWPLDLIAPAAILGLPTDLEIHVRHWQVLNVIGLTVFFSAVFLFAGRNKNRPTSSNVFPILCALSFLFYFAYFFRTGPSYQQWKIASYIPLFFAPFVLASLATVATERYGTSRPVSFILICLGPLLLGINIRHHYRIEPALDEFPSSYANLRALDTKRGITDIYFEMSTMASTFFPVYFLQSKTLHLLSYSYYPQETLAPNKITPTTPLFIEGDTCTTDANSVSVAGVGCLYFRAPALILGASYSFSKNIPALYVSSGMSGVEAWGRWSDGKHLKMALLLDDELASADGVRYLNLQVHPFPAANSDAQNVTAVWGRGEKSEMAVRGQEWISFPFRSRDLSGYQNRQLVLELELPNATAPNSLDPLNGDTRELGLGFTNLSVTDAPLGR